MEPQSGACYTTEPNDTCGMRATAASMLEMEIARQEQTLKGMRQLLPVLKQLEAGSPAEVLLWNILCGWKV